VKRLFVFVGILIITNLSAQDQGFLDWDIDSIFDEPPESPWAEPAADIPDSTVLQLIQQRGFTFDAYYRLLMGHMTGWYEEPWSAGREEEGYYQGFVFNMYGSFGIDAQITEAFRAKSVFYYEVPNFNLKLGDFFFDYNFYNAVFFRGGKYNLSWAISPFYDFTNLLSRVSEDGPHGESFIFKTDIPIGIGGIQALALTRADLLNGVIPGIDDFGFGGKYNLALRWADFNLGVFYQYTMPLRGSLSIKTTVLGVELYNEWLAAINIRASAEISGAMNLGFAREFFDGKLRAAGEVLYNAEENTWWYRPETISGKVEVSPFIEGINGALSLSLRLADKGQPRLFLQTFFAPLENSYSVIPGFSLNPWSNIELYLAVPMAFGSKDGYYYSNTINADSNGRPLPFSIMLLLNLNGSVRFRHNYKG
jgi:hypothetical protein